jgi:hypothetical protein
LASFEEIMRRPASEFKAPEAYPVGQYHCLVDGPPETGKSSQKGTDYLRFKLKILKPYKGVDEALAAEMQLPGKTIQHDFYITDGATYRLSEFLRDDLGIEIEGKPMDQAVAEAPGKQLLVTLKHELSQDNKRTFHRVASTAHV